MPPTFPFWFRQRQCKAEAAGDDNLVKVSGPNLGEAILGVARADNQRWRAFMRSAPDGGDLAATEPEMDNSTDAWEAAFELYRTHVIV